MTPPLRRFFVPSALSTAAAIWRVIGWPCRALASSARQGRSLAAAFVAGATRRFGDVCAGAAIAPTNRRKSHGAPRPARMDSPPALSYSASSQLGHLVEASATPGSVICGFARTEPDTHAGSTPPPGAPPQRTLRGGGVVAVMRAWQGGTASPAGSLAIPAPPPPPAPSSTRCACVRASSVAAHPSPAQERHTSAQELERPGR